LSNRTRALAAVGAAAMALAISACGGGDGGDGPAAADDVASLGTDQETDPGGSNGTPETTAPVDVEEAQLAFAECMREHGIDMPDPGSEGGIQIMANEENQDEVDAAMEECQPILENARGAIELDPEQEAEMREQVLEFTDCMREQGIDMPDPVFSDDGGFSVEMGAPAEGGGDGDQARPTDDEEFQAAAEECGGPGGGMTISSDTVAAED
jgi:hypothetical protein